MFLIICSMCIYVWQQHTFVSTYVLNNLAALILTSEKTVNFGVKVHVLIHGVRLMLKLINIKTPKPKLMGTRNRQLKIFRVKDYFYQ